MYEIKRLVGYLCGFILFYAPFAFYQKAIFALLGEANYADIHDFCLRIPLEHIWRGRILAQLNLETITMFLLLGSAFFIGPFFCGKLCIAGAIGEYLSRLLPDKWKIDWGRYVDPAPIRYGILAGFLLSPFWGGYLACAYCNYRLVEAGFSYFIFDERTVLSSSVLVTGLLWLLVFGLFTKGGRGFCNFICPVGAVQNLLHWLGTKFSFAYRIQIKESQCIKCGKCIKRCPMGAIQLHDDATLSHAIHHCITCKQCVEICPFQAITYQQQLPANQQKEVNLCDKQ